MWFRTDKSSRKHKISLRSAKHIVPIILEMIEPTSVVDVGCRRGKFLYVFQKHGVKDILGIDGEWIDKEKLCIPKECFLTHNLRTHLRIDKKFDLVICLEVAEHLQKKYAPVLVETLTHLGPVILFSAAIPFQGGIHHVNEQWPEYWVRLFKEKEYVAIDCIRKRIWYNKKICSWYKQNILFFVKESYLPNNKILLKEYEQNNNTPLSLVHPEIYLRIARIIKFAPSIIKKKIYGI